jgi:exonuclease SbcC
MLEAIEVKDFQSLKDVRLELGKFTVVVGASNSGKSALVRAIRALAENVTSPGVIVRHGAKSAVVVGRVEAPYTVALERGKSLSTYALTDGDEVGLLPKAGVSVPDEVLAILKFVQVEGEDLNFATQFDRPFLLDAPATKVAKVLGDLTNVIVLYDAVREANRRRLGASTSLKVTREAVERLSSDLEQYHDLPEHREQLQKARALFEDSEQAREQANRIEVQLNVVTIARAWMEEDRKKPELPEVSFEPVEAAVREQRDIGKALTKQRSAEQIMALPSIPSVDIDPVLEKRRESRELAKQLSQYELSREHAFSCSTDIALLDEAIAVAEQDVHDALVKEGTCPLCQQKIVK